ncbi:MAG: hypothetical protein OEW94_05170 [Betaproteobacteria bacterium]|nr:hypothetical protein [Betaproteobacteria bacterium]
MISLFGRGKPDHPMADARQARRLLDELPPRDPVKALGDLAHWHESVAATPDFRPEARIELLLMIDAAAQERVKKVTLEYLAPARLSRFQENRLWTAVHGYWREAALAMARAVDLFLQGGKGAERARAQLPALLAAALRALAQQIKWAYLRYGPNDPVVWGAFNRVYGFAEAQGLAGAQSAPRTEFLRGLMLSASAPECLLPAQLEITEKLLAQYAPLLELAPAGGEDLPFWTDVQRPMVPLRASRLLQPGPGVRYFGAGRALAGLASLQERVRASPALQADLGLGAPMEREDALELIGHLRKCWSPQTPERRHRRHAVKSRLGVVNGLAGAIEALDQESSLSFDGGGAENWVVENVSAGGFGALVTQTKGDWLRVGALLALQPEGGSNWLVGVVRRVHRTSGAQARVGIETLAKSPQIVRLSLGASVSGALETGLLLRADGPAAAEMRIALRPGVFAPGLNLESRVGGRQHIYMPARIGERGDDYEIGRFREMVRDE